MATHQFVITGGPCAGKTTGLSILEQKLTQKGYKVIVVSETATELITSGITPWEIPNLQFQSIIIERMINKERTALEAARNFKQDVVILYDRGILDNKAYMTQKEFTEILKKKHLTEVSARDRYDAVFHLVTAADGAESHYTLDNNKARKETIKEARMLDRQTMNCWIGHSHLRVIGNETDFENKMEKLLNEIYSCLGIPVPIEIERKFLIQRPDMGKFSKEYNCTMSKIFQTYLESTGNIERRIRQRGDGKNFSYYYTEKERYTDVSRTERECKITEKEYLKLLSQADRTKKPILKYRYCFVYGNQYFELDIYPDWRSNAILEIELTSEEQKVLLPDFIKIVKEVTDDPDYKNINMAQAFSTGGGTT